MRRPLLLGAAWTASAAAAVGLGFLAVSLVDASASPGTSLAGATGTATPPATTSTAVPTGDPTATSAPSALPATGEYVTVGGTVYADCSSGSPVVAGAPAAGWSVDDSPDPGEMEFESGEQKVEVHVLCTDGVPTFVPDDSNTTSAGAPSAGPTGSPSASVPSAPSTSGGGHGSDDPPGDDDGGDSGGGHGSDDPPGDDNGGDRGGDDSGGHGSDD
ncbi:hypothetical protein [Blastococcus sp. SYSU D00813]